MRQLESLEEIKERVDCAAKIIAQGEPKRSPADALEQCVYLALWEWIAGRRLSYAQTLDQPAMRLRFGLRGESDNRRGTCIAVELRLCRAWLNAAQEQRQKLALVAQAAKAIWG